MLKIYTAQYRYSGPDRLDVTAKGKDPLGRVFAPTWDLIKSIKQGVMSGKEYEERYIRLLKWSRHSYKEQWEELLNRDRVVLVCFCKPLKFYHRVLLANYLEKNFNVQYVGELNLKKGGKNSWVVY